MSFSNSKYSFLFLLCTLVFLSSCDDDDMAPPEGNEEEVITSVVLTFTPPSGVPVFASAEDPDGDGPQDLEVITPIALAPNTSYALTIDLVNTITQERITTEIAEEADEHMFFFQWSKDVFSDPAGDGNVDMPEDDAIRYNDQDINGLPLGLSTIWTTGDATNGTADFRIVLKHQPEVNGTAVKTATSTVNDGDTDMDLTWDIEIQ